MYIFSAVALVTVAVICVNFPVCFVLDSFMVNGHFVKQQFWDPILDDDEDDEEE